MSHRLDTDYLIIGAGATGLTFADMLVDHTDAHITIVDRRAQPGGHWNDAYGFVTLHQPAAFYGVHSMALGQDRIDATGPNQGLQALASGAEVLAYFDQVLHQRLLASGRVRFLPLSTVLEDGSVQSLLTGAVQPVQVRRKVVDCTYFSPEVPATHRPAFSVEPDARLCGPQALPGLWHALQRGLPPPRHFAVLGGGKTAMDTVLWLLQCGVSPEAVHWVVPRDAWVIDRTGTQNAPAFFEAMVGGQIRLLQAFAQAQSVEDLYLRLESAGVLMRLDPGIAPQMFHFATLAPGEMTRLRQVRQVVRKGRVLAVHADRLQLEQGEQRLPPHTLCIDCTASAVRFKPSVPVFSASRITPQLLRPPLVTFSAAVTAYVEAHVADLAQQNALCTPTGFTHRLEDYPRVMLQSLMNQWAWNQHKGLRDWMRTSRLDAMAAVLGSVSAGDTEKLARLGQLREAVGAAASRLQRWETPLQGS